MLPISLLIASGFGASLAEGNDRTAPPAIWSFPASADPRRVGKSIAENLLSRDTMLRADKSGIHYAEICAAEGAITFAHLAEDAGLSVRLEKRYACFLSPGCSLIPPGGSSRYQAALVVFAMYCHNRQPRFLDAASSLVQEKWKGMGNPQAADVMFKTARFWSDDMYFTPTLDPRLYRITGDSNAIDRPANWLIGYIDRLQLPNGLFKHTTQVSFVWGRGVGWAAAGLTNTLLDLPQNHPKRRPLMESYLRLMAGLLPYQSPNGLWRQLIDYPDAWEETSGSAMFTYAMATGIRMGWLEASVYGPVLRRGWLALVDRLDEKGELRDVCIGTNEQLTAQGYLGRPRRNGDYHGQAPMLWTANALLQ